MRVTNGIPLRVSTFLTSSHCKLRPSTEGGSQGVIVSNCTFRDCSGGAVKLGSVTERGDPAPLPTTPDAEQDRGFLVSDCLMDGIPVEYGSVQCSHFAAESLLLADICWILPLPLVHSVAGDRVHGCYSQICWIQSFLA
jgi:hypothetical protein